MKMIVTRYCLSRQTRIVLLCLLGPGPVVLADSALPLLSGFDAERISQAYPVTDESAAGEMAKLMYRLRRLPPRSLRQRVGEIANAKPGDVVAISGSVAEIDSLPVPTDLVSYVDADELLEMVVEIAPHGRTVNMIGDKIAARIQIGDRIAAVAVVIASGDQADRATTLPSAVAAVDFDWLPARVPYPGWGLLRDQGVDVGEIADLAARNRRSLQPDDNDAFYTMLAAAKSLSGQSDFPEPVEVDPVALLRRSEDWIGRWLRIELETVQVTRVFVTDPYRQQQLGSDHYYQIDAVADLRNVVIRIEPEQSGGEPALFENRFPVSLVVAELPDFIAGRIDQTAGGTVVSSPLRGKIGVDGFLFRLWSYSSQFMDSHGGGNQIGPLVVAAKIRDQEPRQRTLPGLTLIPIMAAVAVVGAVLAIACWHYRSSVTDRQARRRRQGM